MDLESNGEAALLNCVIPQGNRLPARREIPSLQHFNLFLLEMPNPSMCLSPRAFAPAQPKFL